MSKTREYFQISDKDIAKVRKIFKKDENDVKEDLRILNEWWKKQQHLPKNTDDVRLERVLLRNKFRIEQAKVKVDNYYTLRVFYPDFFDDIKNNFESVMKAGCHLNMVPLPVLTEDCERIILCRVPKKDSTLDWNKVFSYMFLLLEIEMTHDYAVGERYIMDWTNISFSDYKTMELNMLMKGMAVYQDGYSARILGIEYFNAPSFLDLFLGLLKLAVKPKIFEKIRIHKSLSDLHKIVDPKYLPSDFGGSLKETSYYHDKIRSVIYEQKQTILKNLELVSDESLRIGKPLANNLFGVEGTFKKLNID